jgi:hypothetical protein
MATRSLVIAREKNKIKVFLFYVCSLLSHPITICWSVWAGVYYYIKINKSVKLTLKYVYPLLFASAIVGIANILYYNEIYVEALGVSKYSPFNSMADRLLALGRYMMQIVYPLQYASFYFNGSILNVIGIPISVVAIYLSIKGMKTEDVIIYWALYLAGLGPVVANMTHIFLSDTYLLMPSFALLMLFAKYTNNKKQLETLKAKLIFSILLIFLSYRSYVEALYFTNPRNYFENSYVKENSCINLIYYTKALFRNNETVKAALHGEQMIRRKCIWGNKRNVDTVLYAQTLLFSNSHDVEAREKALKQLIPNALYYKFAYAGFLQRNGRNGWQNVLEEVLSRKELKNVNEKDPVVRMFVTLCEKKQFSYCSKLMDKIKMQVYNQ